MRRLNKKAFNILKAAIETAAAKDSSAGEVAKQIAFKRLDRLYNQRGKLVTEAELISLFQDILPHLTERDIKRASKANRPPSKLWLIPKLGLFLTGFAGFIWLVNLPYPMIRRPVARTAPILLLPSYLSMDYNYRQAIAKVEQADRLVNNATTIADLELGATKVAESQKHLDKLPVWFLGYQPQMYRTFFSVGWFFTFDEFKAARAKIGRMEAIVFQEKNAMQKLEIAENNIEQAKQEYQQEKVTIKQNALKKWQTSLDQLSLIPSSTLAGRIAAQKLNIYQRDFQEISGFIVGNNRTNTIIAVAQKYSTQAVSNCDNPPHSVERWQQCANLWQDAIDGLARVPLEDPGYLDAQGLLATYKTSLGDIKIRLSAEANSVKAFEVAQAQIVDLPKTVNSNNRERVARQILRIINQLEKVQSGTTVYEEASQLIIFANKKLKEIES